MDVQSRPTMPGGRFIIDGGLSTQLQCMGYDVHGDLWTARLLADDPAAISSAHRAFVEAGAEVVITASYQVSRQGFVAAGRTAQEADTALRDSVIAAREATAGTSVLVAASVGPYGAVLHDGSEYRGRYGLSHRELMDFHRERLEVLVAAEPDLLAIETIPDVDEAAALADVLCDFRHLPAWMTFSTIDDAHVCAGQPIEEAVAAVAHEVSAIGINCTDATHITRLLRRMRAATDAPLVAYPNAGGVWNAETGQWIGAAGGPFEDVDAWRSLGTSFVGGCCGTDAEAIRILASSAR